MTESSNPPSVLTPPPAKTEFLGPGITTDFPAPHPADFRTYLGTNRRLDSLGSLGHYEILEVIGRGGFGVVLKAFDEKLERYVAIKMLDPALGLTSPVRKSFLREARSAAKVRHENVVQIYAVEESPLPYLVMEYIDGDTLQHRLDANGPLEAGEVVELGRQVCAGLAAAHDQGLIHRDIKPANILIERGPVPRVKLTDFGLARTADDASLTRSGVIVGTPLYMAPEQASAETIDHRADLFSLGSVLYAMASGRPPFRAPTSIGVMNRVVNEKPRPIRNIVPEVPEGLCGVIAHLHQKSPEERPQTAREAAEELGRCLTNPVVPATAKRMFRPALGILGGALTVAAVAVFAWRPWRAEPEIAANAPAPRAPATMSAPPVAPARAMTAWELHVSKLSPDEQVLEVCRQFKARRADFDVAKVRHRIESDQVVMFEIDGTTVTDLTPLRGFPALQELVVTNSGTSDLSPLQGLPLRKFTSIHNPVRSLAPLQGMPLIELTVWGLEHADLSPLRGMNLVWLNCGLSPVQDLSPLAGMPLGFLCINISQVSDLSPLKGMPLKHLLMEGVPCSDLGPIAGLPIERLYLGGSKVVDHGPVGTLQSLNELKLDYVPERDRTMLKAMPALKTINAAPAAEFLGS